MNNFIDNRLNALQINQKYSLNPTNRWLLKIILATFGRLISIENISNIKNAPSPAIYVLNHNNYLESILVPSILIQLRDAEKISFIIDWMFGCIPIIGYLLKQIDPIYVYNKPSSIKFLNTVRKQVKRNQVIPECITRLSKKQSIGIFPEGTRNYNPCQLLKAHNGLGEIALKSGVPILPIGIDFPNRQYLKRIPELGRLILRAGKPLTFPKEIAIYRQLQQRTDLTKNELRKIELYLSSNITTAAMKEIAQLSGKTYPYPPLTLPDELKSMAVSQIN